MTTKIEKEWANTEGERKTNPCSGKRVWLNGKVVRSIGLSYFICQTSHHDGHFTKTEKNAPTEGGEVDTSERTIHGEHACAEDAIVDVDETTVQLDQ